MLRGHLVKERNRLQLARPRRRTSGTRSDTAAQPRRPPRGTAYRFTISVTFVNPRRFASSSMRGRLSEVDAPARRPHREDERQSRQRTPRRPEVRADARIPAALRRRPCPRSAAARRTADPPPARPVHERRPRPVALGEDHPRQPDRRVAVRVARQRPNVFDRAPSKRSAPSTSRRHTRSRRWGRRAAPPSAGSRSRAGSATSSSSRRNPPSSADGTAKLNATSRAASNPSMSGFAFRKLTLPTRNVRRD